MNTAYLLNTVGSDPSSSNTATPTIRIDGDGGAAVYECAIDGVSIGQYRTTDMFGHVDIYISTPLGDGPHTFTANELSPHQASVVPLIFKVDTIPPAIPIITSISVGTINALGKYPLTVRGTADATAWMIRVYSGLSGIGGSTVQTGSWTASTTALVPGVYQITAKATDKAGNTSPKSVAMSITVGTQPTITVPAAPVLTGGASVTSLSWNTPLNGGSPILGYDVFRNGQKIANVVGTSYKDTASFKGAVYKVVAINSVGNSVDSNAITP